MSRWLPRRKRWWRGRFWWCLRHPGATGKPPRRSKFLASGVGSQHGFASASAFVSEGLLPHRFLECFSYSKASWLPVLCQRCHRPSTGAATGQPGPSSLLWLPHPGTEAKWYLKASWRAFLNLDAITSSGLDGGWWVLMWMRTKSQPWNYSTC